MIEWPTKDTFLRTIGFNPWKFSSIDRPLDLTVIPWALNASDLTHLAIRSGFITFEVTGATGGATRQGATVADHSAATSCILLLKFQNASKIRFGEMSSHGRTNAVIGVVRRGGGEKVHKLRRKALTL